MTKISVPTRSNYLAPWAIYAFAWYKWPMQHCVSKYDGEKMAVESYAEDGPNFGRTPQPNIKSLQDLRLTMSLDSNSRHSC